jgi:VanZ family protein
MRWFSSTTKVAFFAGGIGVVVLSLLPASQAPSLFNDKLEHLFAYAILGLVGGLAFPTWRATLWMIALLPLLAIALELGQELVPGRSTEIADAVVSSAGSWLTLLPWLAVRLMDLRMAGHAGQDVSRSRGEHRGKHHGKAPIA